MLFAGILSVIACRTFLTTGQTLQLPSYKAIAIAIVSKECTPKPTS